LCGWFPKPVLSALYGFFVAAVNLLRASRNEGCRVALGELAVAGISVFFSTVGFSESYAADIREVDDARIRGNRTSGSAFQHSSVTLRNLLFLVRPQIGQSEVLVLAI